MNETNKKVSYKKMLEMIRVNYKLNKNNLEIHEESNKIHKLFYKSIKLLTIGLIISFMLNIVNLVYMIFK